MKNTVLILITTVFALSSVAVEKIQPLQLELESLVRTLRLGQSTQLKLKISGSDVCGITEATEGVVPEHLKKGPFSYQFNFKPQREGSFKLGPYCISMNGQKLTSNQIEINVLPQWEGVYGTIFRTNKKAIKLGEPFELVVERWSFADDRIIPNSLKKDDALFSSKSCGTSISTLYDEGERFYYRKRSWLVTPRTTGEFSITKELFSQFPANTPPPDLKIMVNEKQ